MKTIINTVKTTPKRSRRIEFERGPFLGLAIGYERHSYKQTKERDLTILFLCFSLRYTLKIYKEVKNEYTKS